VSLPHRSRNQISQTGKLTPHFHIQCKFRLTNKVGNPDTVGFYIPWDSFQLSFLEERQQIVKVIIKFFFSLHLLFRKQNLLHHSHRILMELALAIGINDYRIVLRGREISFLLDSNVPKVVVVHIPIFPFLSIYAFCNATSNSLS